MYELFFRPQKTVILTLTAEIAAMGEIKNGRELWTELSKLYASAPNGKPKHAQLEGLMERATGKKIQNVTGFNLTDWKAAGEEARYRPGGSLPKSLNPVKDIQFLKSWFLGEGNGPQLKGDPWARR